MMKLLEDGEPGKLTAAESLTQFTAQMNEAGAREVDGRQFSDSSLKKFLSRLILDERGAPTDYERSSTQDCELLGLDKELVDQIVSGTYAPPQLPKKPKEEHDQTAKRASKKAKGQEGLDEETERIVEVLMKLMPDPMAKVPYSETELYDKFREHGLKVYPSDMGKGEVWGQLPLKHERLYRKYAIPRLAKSIPQEVIIEKSLDAFRSALRFRDPQKGEPYWKDLCQSLNWERAIAPSGRMFTPTLAKEFYYSYYLPYLEKEAATTEEETVAKVKKEKKDTQQAQTKRAPSEGKNRASKTRSTATTAAPELRPVVGPDEKLVADAVAFINEKANEALYKHSIEIGNYLLENFFNGDIAAASSRNPRKPASYRALCEHSDLGPSPGALSIMLRVAAQEKLFQSEELPLEQLTYSHKAELVKVFDNKIKVKLFKEAVKKSLTVRELQDRVREKKGLVSISQLGQGRDGSVTRFNFESLLKTKALSDPEALKSLPEKKRNELKERVEGAYAVLARLLDEYSRLKDLFADLEKG